MFESQRLLRKTLRNVSSWSLWKLFPSYSYLKLQLPEFATQILMTTHCLDRQLSAPSISITFQLTMHAESIEPYDQLNELGKIPSCTARLQTLNLKFECERADMHLAMNKNDHRIFGVPLKKILLRFLSKLQCICFWKKFTYHKSNFCTKCIKKNYAHTNLYTPDFRGHLLFQYGSSI